ncbi:acyl-CoA dehydrogenase family protein [Millisia brevis]|uniref:acyl-CoA dehydrogenase family protein n=1 Tax=Millisia brevis TaxID=264148 RepID=UPI000833BEB1|nr:acyl-CoA dehydrogenase family protein [Millisia brevis]
MTSTASAATLSDLERRAGRVLPAIAEQAADREAQRRMPFEQIRLLAAEGLGTWRIPGEVGGPGASARRFFEFLLDLAAADANIAQALRSHFAFVETLRTLPDGERKQHWFDRALAGELFGIAGGEVGGAHGAIATTVRPDDAGWSVTGTKFYSTGTLFADLIVVRAVDEQDRPRQFVIPADRTGVERIDDWDGIGQRLTASGTTRLTAVRVHDDEFLDLPEPGVGRPKVSPFFQLALAAIEVGIGRAALADAIAWAREKARPIKHAGVARSVDDPYVRQAVGEMSALIYAAEATVLGAAEAIGRVDDARERGLDEQEPLVAASLDVSRAHFVAVEAALKASTLLFDVGGASATQRLHNLDRHWRNARTIASHNPRAHKLNSIGAYLLDDIEPPLSGFF